jgi:ATP-dependent DNA helicase RecQ
MNTKALGLLKQYFGYDSFRPMQAQIVESILNKKDTLVLMPTGGGKSICFQIPALIMPGICIVVSPLISLMKDQVDTLNANGIAAAFLNSSLDLATQNKIIRKCSNNEIKILYISPERVAKEIDYLLKRLPINLFAIDEAHCVSSWGHEFRPEYTNLRSLKTNFPHIPVIALTATANNQTKADIIKQLHLVNPEVFVASFDRPNLNISVKLGTKPKQKTEEIISFIKKRVNDTGIIYCLSRNSCDKLSETLKLNGVNAASYHAGLPSEERHRVQTGFIQDQIQVICATIAFGMGIDKSNVRYVIHFNVPKSIEGYYQEIGRAGRDGLPSETLMYFGYGDLTILRSFAMNGNQSQLNLDKLKQVERFAEAVSCRRRILLSYFGETIVNDCGNCDVCLPVPEIELATTYDEVNYTKPVKGKGSGNYSVEIFEKFRVLRRQIADGEKLPAYIIFSDATLKDMAEKLPRTLLQMLEVSGVGQKKLEKYGQQFLDLILESKTFPTTTITNVEYKERVNKKQAIGNSRHPTIYLSSKI